MVKHTQTIRRLLPTNCLTMFDHFVRLALKGLKQYENRFSYCYFRKIPKSCYAFVRILGRDIVWRLFSLKFIIQTRLHFHYFVLYLLFLYCQLWWTKRSRVIDVKGSVTLHRLSLMLSLILFKVFRCVTRMVFLKSFWNKHYLSKLSCFSGKFVSGIFFIVTFVVKYYLFFQIRDCFKLFVVISPNWCYRWY